MGSASPMVTADTYARSAKASTNYGNASTLRLGSGYETYVYFPRPFPMAATIRSATLRVWLGAALSAGTKTITVQRALKTWAESSLKWSNRPGVTGSAVNPTTTATAKNGMVELDVTTLMQSVSDGSASAWFGLRLTSATAITLWSSEASVTAMRPRLVVEWDDQPNPPAKLYPSGGRAVSVPAPVVRCDFTDVSGDTRCAGVQVRLFNIEAAAVANTTPTWDSGQTASSNPELNLAAAGWGGAAAGVVWWWLVRVQDGAGLWSGWSLPASFTYRPLPTVTLDQPSGATISDPTPAIWWTSAAQSAYQSTIRDAATGATLWDTGRVTDTDTQIEPPEGIVQTLNQAYIISVSVWDTYAREATPGAPTATTVSRTVTYTTDGTVTAPSALTAVQVGQTPSVRLNWTLASVPDRFVVRRNGRVIATLDPADVSLTSTTYQWTDPAAPGWVSHTYQVSAVVAGKGSVGASAAVQFELTGFWIIDPAGDIAPIPLLGTSVDWAMGEDSAWHSPVGAAGSVLITQALRGMEGSASDDRPAPKLLAGTTADEIAARMLTLRDNPGKLVHIAAHRYAFPAVMAGIQVVAVDQPAARTWSIRFAFREDATGPYGVAL